MAGEQAPPRTVGWRLRWSLGGAALAGAAAMAAAVLVIGPAYSDAAARCVDGQRDAGADPGRGEAVDVETVSGPVTFDGPLDANGRYEFETHSGSIRVAVPAGTGFDLEAQSFSGSFASNATITLSRGSQAAEVPAPAVLWEGADGREIEGTVGGGGRLELSTFSGDMTIVVVGDR